MQDLKGRVAVVTGGASGIGLGFANVFGQHGMKLMLADIEADALDAAVSDLAAKGYEVAGQVVDVTQSEQVDALAEQTWSRFGGAHVVCNNAGVVARHDAWGSLEDWKWVIDVDLWGVVHGVHSFLPRMLADGDEGHIVNTASVAGLFGFGGISSYVAAKHAVVGLSQSLHHELVASPIGVSVLCPGLVRTNIVNSERNRPGVEMDTEAPQFDLSGETLEPADVASIVVDAIQTERFWVLPQSHYGNQAVALAQGRVDGTPPPLPRVDM